MIMAYSNSNSKVVPEAREALEKFKYEVASDVSVKNLFIKNKYILSYFIFLNTYINLFFYFSYWQFYIAPFYFLLIYLNHLAL